jgi:Tfp pilus assembly protein PilZ
VNLPVTLKEGEAEQPARMTNLSGGGMAVRTVKPLKQGAVLDLAFELSLGARISTRGQVAWVNSEGMAGIILQGVRGKGNEQLQAWLASREQLRSETKTPET